MNEINFRIKKLVDIFCKGNNSAFARKVDDNQKNIVNYLNGTEPKFSFLKKLTEKLEINPEWLLTGEGEMLKKKFFEVQEDNEVDKKNESTELSSISEKLDFISNNLRIIKMLNDIRFTIIADKLDIELDVDISENMFKDEFNESKRN